MMIRNYYYLVVGILSIVFALSHAWNGQSNFLPAIDSSGISMAAKTTTFYVWHILTAENLIFGIALLVMSVSGDLSKVKFTAWTIVVIMIARWTVIFGSTLIKNRSSVSETLTDSIAIIVFVTLIILGTRKK
jgi:hypothetical protein